MIWENFSNTLLTSQDEAGFQDFGARSEQLELRSPNSARLSLKPRKSSTEIEGFPHFLEGEIKEHMMAVNIEYAQVIGLREITHDY